MSQSSESSAIDEKQLQREAEAHRRPFGQTRNVALDGAGDTPLELEKTDTDEPVETSLRGEANSDERATEPHDRPPTEPAVQP